MCADASGGVWYVRGLERWPEPLAGKPVLVLGHARRQAYVPVASADESGAWAQGKTEEGEDDVIDALAWLPAPPWVVDYHDGSNNHTHVEMRGGDSAVEWSYEPTQPANSSSGCYSGGEAASGVVELRRAADVWSALFGVLSARDNFSPTRQMGTGAITVHMAEASISAVVERCGTLDAFEEELGKLRTSSNQQ